MVKLASTLSRLKPVKVMVIGDMMLDSYTIGKVRRISPEAPVAVVHVQKEEQLPGGSGNVILNLVSLGAEVVAIGRIGRDWGGECLREVFEKEGIATHSLMIQEGYKTPVKNRVIADNQQVVRVDHEHITPLPEQLEQTMIDSLPELMQGVKVVAISDYGKGFLTPTLLSAVISYAKKQDIVVIADPKGHDFTKYRGATIIKPNLSEAYTAANLPTHTPLEAVAQRILQITDAEMLMITRSEAGISLFSAFDERFDFPVQIKQVTDVTGAGDTVLAMLTCALANDLSYSEAVQLCNVAASIAIERVGCARVSLSDLAHRLLEHDGRNKFFDEEHLFVLQEVLKKEPFTLLAISHVDHLTQSLFKSIKILAQNQGNLLIYLVDNEVDESFIEMLASLHGVDFILIHEESLRLLCENSYPKETYLFRESELKPIKDVSRLLVSIH